MKLESVPTKILVNLQTLDLNRCNIRCLPSTIWKLHQLRHVHGSWSRLRLSQSMMDLCGWLTNLQILAFGLMIVVGWRILLRKIGPAYNTEHKRKIHLLSFSFHCKNKKKKNIFGILFSLENIPIF